jgi:hypothetical protein
MDFDTTALQVKIAEQLHWHDKCQHLEETEQGLDNCWHRQRYITKAAFVLGRIMPTLVKDIVIPTRRHWAARIADRIRDELVCCDIHEQIERALSTGEFPPHTTPRQVAGVMGLSYHAICRYGGWAAALAEEEGVAGANRGEV